jgi:hypothetical protein
MSKRRRTSGVNISGPVTESTPEAPGPPGLYGRTRMRAPGSAARRRATAISIVRPRGFDQSSGTVRGRFRFRGK